MANPRHNSKDRRASQIPVPTQVTDEDKNVPDVTIEGESSVVDDLVKDLKDVKDMREKAVALGKQADALRKIVTEQNGKIKEMEGIIGRLQKAKAFTAEDEQRLHSIFGEISFDRGTTGLSVTIGGNRRPARRCSRRWRRSARPGCSVPRVRGARRPWPARPGGPSETGRWASSTRRRSRRSWRCRSLA
jgi:hypothetical protein